MQIFNEAIYGLLRSKCRFLATHHLHLLPRFDKIIWLVDGRVEARGTYKDLMATNPGFRDMIDARGHQKGEDEKADEQEHKDTARADDQSGGIADANVDTVGLIQEETRIVDSVPLYVYVSWLQASGSVWNGLVMLVGQALFRASSIFGSLWLSWLVQDKYGLTLGQNIGIYTGLSLAQIVLLFTSSLVICLICIKSSQVMANDALWRTLWAPISLFETTPLGRMIYRFTRDIDALHNNLVVTV
ncbi:hypothetical protein GGR56DRAFT_77068 [Xylariaceae sp. FL0804]|nr:hypothetical protein GGR56DRAFT_77068 [Xylariaceae sp. FL0804]